jgi:hypothetical protein
MPVGLFKRRRTHVAAMMLALSVAMTAVFSGGATAEADAFQRTWMRTDKPVADGQVGRTWMWGPMETAVEVTERYFEAPNGERQVMYFDKSRMEVTNPGGDPNSIWYVTNGLLVQEMVTGEMQMGDSFFDHVGAAQVNVARFGRSKRSDIRCPGECPVRSARVSGGVDYQPDRSQRRGH